MAEHWSTQRRRPPARGGAWSLLLAGLLLLGACAPPLRVETLEPGFDGTRTIRLRGNVLPASTGTEDMELNVERVERPKRDAELALLVEVHGASLRIRSGESLQLLIDGDSLRLSRDARAGAWRHPAPSVREQARYPTDAALLRRLTAASDVRVVVVGAAWKERRRLSAKNLAAIRDFLGAEESR